MKYILTITKTDGTQETTATRKIKRVHHAMHAMPSSEVNTYYLKVVYGLDIDNYGRRTLFYNDGEYRSLDRTAFALACFTEKT